MKKALSLFLSFVMMLSAGSFSASAFAASAPEKTEITKLTANAKGFTVKWKKVSCSGYQIQYSTNKSFESPKKISVKSSKTSYKASKLKSKKKYYVRIRAKSGKKYSAWSKTKSVTTKKSSSSSSGSSSSSSKKGNTVYITPTGKRYHYDESCAGENAIKTTLSEAESEGYTPCKKCAA